MFWIREWPSGLSATVKHVKGSSVFLILNGVESPLDRLTSLTGVREIDLITALRYATIRSDLRSKGQLIPDNDLWIAATALAHDLTLATGDRHFERVPGLKLYH